MYVSRCFRKYFNQLLWATLLIFSYKMLASSISKHSSNNAFWFSPPKIFILDWHLRHTWPVTRLRLTQTNLCPFIMTDTDWARLRFEAQIEKQYLASITNVFLQVCINLFYLTNIAKKLYYHSKLHSFTMVKKKWKSCSRASL